MSGFIAFQFCMRENLCIIILNGDLSEYFNRIYVEIIYILISFLKYIIKEKIKRTQINLWQINSIYIYKYKI